MIFKKILEFLNSFGNIHHIVQEFQMCITYHQACQIEILDDKLYFLVYCALDL